MKSSTTVLIKALQVLSKEIQSEDGVANAAIAEAAVRLKELDNRVKELEDLIADVIQQLEKIT